MHDRPNEAKIKAETGNERMANKVKEIWAAGKVVVNGWLAIPSGFSAEVMAQCGFDSVRGCAQSLARER